MVPGVDTKREGYAGVALVALAVLPSYERLWPLALTPKSA